MRLSKLKVTANLISKFNPCGSRFNNFKEQYPNFKGTVIQFLNLDKITAQDKIWVCVRILPRELVETFAIDCAFAAYADAAAAAYAAAYADAADAATAAAYADYADATAAYAAAYAADAADAADAAYAAYAESERQVDALIYLVKGWD